MLKIVGGFAGAVVLAALMVPVLTGYRAVGKETPPAATLAADPKATADTVRLLADNRGHFRADVEIESRRVEMMVDTGASMIALRYEDAEQLGLLRGRVAFTGRVSTANGVAFVAPVRLSRVKIGGIILYDVEAVIAERGKLGANLLGMSFLKRLSKVEVSRNALLLAK